MKFKSIFLFGISLPLLAMADDTEIYGAAAIDENSRVNSNVLFIVDNSGSMRGEVIYFNNPYDPAVSYSGSYDANHFYLGTNESSWEGIPLTSLETSESTNCEDSVNTLNSTGKITGRYQQYYSVRWRGRTYTGWTDNLDDSREDMVRCEISGATSRTLYSGNYMNFYHDPGNRVSTDRMEVVKQIVTDLTYSLKDVNIGMMRFDTGDTADLGGMVEIPIDDIDNNAQLIRDTVATYDHETWTPLSETLYEASLYYSGGKVDYGNRATPESADSSRDSSDEDSYESPIKQSCQKNHVILLTDGDPSRDTGASSEIESLISGITLPATSGLEYNCSSDGDGGCLDELAYYMNVSDMSDDHAGSQVVSTYTVGAFGDITDTDMLKRAARWGGGAYYEAEDPDALSEAINSIFLDILAQDATFTAPAISVNAFNNSEHRDELFYALFKPNDKAKWNGNLKKYRLGSDGKIYDKNSNLAIDSSTGFFSSSSQDFWSTVDGDDGKDVTLGGIANILSPETRTLYSDDSNGDIDTFENVANASTLNVQDDEVGTLKNWVRGFENGSTNNPPRYYIGDPLHSEPVVITYGGTDDNPDSTIYFGTNEGFIHAIDTETGAEEFAFIPQDLHGIQNILYEDNTPAGSRPYGMDGPVTTWMYDLNSNNVIYNQNGSLESGEHAYIYAGMRRGGRDYYALDVTNRDNPNILFKIQGGDTGFEQLGQTWSEMTVAKVKFNGAERFVAFFTGGYDVNQDSNNVRENDTVGNAIYMVDATTGERLWWASKTNANLNIPDMKNSMPASAAIVDINGDGFVNYLYAADTGGRVFRIDINQKNTGASDFAEGGVIAELADNTEAGNRRFYNKPSVAIVKDKEYGDYITIAIGSGHRAHPILTKNVENRFYVIKDFYPYGKPASYSKTTEAPTNKTSLATGEKPSKTTIYNATSLMLNGETSLTADMERIMLEGGGWYVTLNTAGEKALSQATTFSGAVIFTTFSPSSATSGNPCEPDTGTSRVYALDQRWGMAAVDLNNDGKVDKNDAFKILTNSGIAPRPVVIYRKGGGKSITLGTESIDDSRFKENSTEQCNANNCYATPNYWRENIKDYDTDASSTGG